MLPSDCLSMTFNVHFVAIIDVLYKSVFIYIWCLNRDIFSFLVQYPHDIFFLAMEPQEITHDSGAKKNVTLICYAA